MTVCTLPHRGLIGLITGIAPLPLPGNPSRALQRRPSVVLNSEKVLRVLHGAFGDVAKIEALLSGPIMMYRPISHNA